MGVRCHSERSEAQPRNLLKKVHREAVPNLSGH